MKPEDLIDAMSMISQDYVTEAKPIPKQHSESRRTKRDAAGNAERITVSRSSAATGKDYTMKKLPSIHRFATVFAATAACAVFACGGWFIVKQAKQQHELGADSQASVQDSEYTESNSSTVDVQEVTRNFLGGQGEVHAMRCFLESNGLILYDDTRWYFPNLAYYADRTAGRETVYHAMTGETAEYCSRIQYDGSRFYYADGLSLYELKNDGTRAEEPFFTLTDDKLPEGTAIDSLTSCYRIVKMTDDAYFLTFHLAEMDSFQAVYHTDGTLNLLSSDEWYENPQRCEDGSLLAIREGNTKHDAIVRIKPDGSVSDITQFQGDTNIVDYMAVHDDKLYVLLESYGENGKMYTDYAAIDLETRDIQILDRTEAPTDTNAVQVFSNGQQDFILKTFAENHTFKFYSTDPEWKNQQELLSLDASSDLPDAVRKNFNRNDRYSIFVSAPYADAHYVILDLSYKQYAVYEIETGNVQFIYTDVKPTGDVTQSEALHVDESLYNVLDPGFTGTNFLGGQGALHLPKDGSSSLWYDDTNFYMPTGCFPREGNTLYKISEATDCSIRYALSELISDGTRLYAVEGGAMNLVDNSGTLTPFFRLSDAGLTDDARIISIFRVGDSYFFGMQNMDAIEYEQAASLRLGRHLESGDPNAYSAYVWTDKNGNILEAKKNLPLYTSFWAGSHDDRSKYVYYFSSFDADKVHRIAEPGSGEAPIEFMLPGYDLGTDYSYVIEDIIDDKILYQDESHAFCGYEPDTGEHSVIFAADTKEIQGAGGRFTSVIIKDKLYYMMTDPFSEQPGQTDIMEYNLTTGETQKALTFDASSMNNTYIMSQYSNKLYFFTTNTSIWFDPETNETFSMNE